MPQGWKGRVLLPAPEVCERSDSAPCPSSFSFLLLGNQPVQTSWLKTTIYYLCDSVASLGSDRQFCYTKCQRRGHSLGCIQLLDGPRWQVKESFMRMSGALVLFCVALLHGGLSCNIVVLGWPNFLHDCLPRGKKQKLPYKA